MWLLFSVCATPIHVWALILFFRDFSWISERTDSWDAIGVGSYGLLVALVESFLVFVLAYGASYILPKSWPEKQRIILIGVLTFLVAAWAIVGQLYFLFEVRFPNNLIRSIAQNSHPLWILYSGVLGLVGLTALVPVIFIMKSNRLQNCILEFFERLTTLAALYLLMDLSGFIIVIVRNI